ncbi:efflux RND transporter periplasmic adaptor subunit [Wenzhouxiangella marina]|uniref:RND family efflux transporter MFP subunit n=1 Tax=Wenzhouxiangella marina TaxID=1579979 RepID=A0A0K0XS63_9GAMM|nr:HlyD family efflux transporter periplasmic adaptor subunit [Wenzhouxiangella marina]AKS40528.1 RND family efflux transporter MFP subunit [Wenzhouxiangella marina]MBB6088148.1 HlyD family secretion protein [Wenzhouxiangella marina]
MDIHRPELKRRKRQLKILWVSLAIVLAVVLVAGLSLLEPAAPAVDRATVWTDTVRRGDMVREVRGPGTLVPREIRWIATTTEARVDRVLVRPGGAVTPDTVLVEMSNPTLSQQVLEARSEVIAAEADFAALEVRLQSEALDQRATLAEVRAEAESARLQVQAEAELLERDILPRIQYQRSVLRADQLQERLAIEQERTAQFQHSVAAQLRAARARIDQLADIAAYREAQLAALQVTAGIHGVLQEMSVEAGQRLSPGENIARVAQPDTLLAELRIPETQAKDVQLDQTVEVDTRNGIVPGRVIRIDPRVANGTVQVDVELTGPLPAGARPDLSVDGTIRIEQLDDVLYVRRPAYGQPESTVRLFRIDPSDGSAVRVPVELGRSSVNVIEIRQGLNPGDEVILSDTSAWDEFDRIRLQ